jgi:competence protein ComEA
MVLGWAMGLASLPCLPQETSRAPSPVPAEQRVDVNRATMEELMKVPGMTRVWAGRIVRFRPYRTKMDLLERGVLSSEVYNRIKDYVIAHREKQ